MSDLTSLMNIAPGTSAFFMGQNQAQQRALKDLEQMKMAAEASQTAEKHRADMEMAPLKMQNQSLMNQGLERGLAGITADSSLKTTNARKAGATADSDISTILSNNESTKGKNSEEARARTTKFLLEAGPLLGNTPAPLRAGVFQGMIKQAGMNANNPQVQQMLLLAQNNPEAFPQAISQLANKLGEQAVMMNPAARVSRENTAAKIAADAEQGNLNRTNLKEIAGIQAASREAVAATAEKGIEELGTDKALGMAILKSNETQDPEKKKFWQQVANDIIRAKQIMPQGRTEGTPQLDTEGGGLVPRAAGNLYGQNQPQVGQTKSGVKYKIVND